MQKSDPRKIQFRVSARTAKLIGEENFSNPEGAVIELVKNCYDADAKLCLVIFDVVFSEIPTTLSKDDFKKYASISQGLKKFYELSKGGYNLIDKINDKELADLLAIFLRFNSAYIIDNGEGMDKETIQTKWMEIGTGNKATEYISDGKRVKTGAKGIGRFALDRLGQKTEMWTAPKSNTEGSSYWQMDWSQFEAADKLISDISADLDDIALDLKPFLLNRFAEFKPIKKIISSTKFESGTVIKISGLKDIWDLQSLSGIDKNLEALIPPKELQINFNVYFFNLQKINLFGEVDTAFFNDYDYNVVSSFNAKELLVKMKITRNELDMKVVKKEFKHIFKDLEPPFDVKTLEQKSFEIELPINDLLKWEKSAQNEKQLKDIGNFSFAFYFLKNQLSQKEEYPFKQINSKERKEIIDKFGGIRIYRDSFRVRPYGDPGNDWLKLGERAAQSPAGPGQRIGDWRVRPNQVAGFITISRLENSGLNDKSDRGALIENDSFATMQSIVKSVIGYFELDRTKILNPFYKDAKIKEELKRTAEIRVEAERLADKIIEERLKVEEKVYGKKADLFQAKKQEEEKLAYQGLIVDSLTQIEKNEANDAEIAQVRTLASLGLIVSSFSHELKEVKNNINDINELEVIYSKVVPEVNKKLIEYKDGVNIISSLKKDTEKIIHWVEYSLTAIKKDKRKRGSLKFDKYFDTLAKEWKKVLNNRNIEIQLNNKIFEKYTFRAFEMDMNTIFSNLISNSIDAFNNLKIHRERKIVIDWYLANKKIVIEYSDNGTGLPNVFKDKDEIFLPFVTSKKDKNGNDIGTGLGMYLVKSVVLDNNGNIDIIDSKVGFKLKIEFQIKD